jgi:hypothetical protein
VDGEVIYTDISEVENDLPTLDAAVQQKGTLDRAFDELHLVLSHRDDDLHTIIDVRITREVMVGECEMHITLSSRLASLRIRAGDSARAFAERVQAFAADEAGLERALHAANALTRQLGEALERAIVGASARIEPAMIQLIRPTIEQIGRFRNLGFGAQVQVPRYRPLPMQAREGAYADFFGYYYFDPYHALVSYWLISAMIEDACWRSPHVHVVDHTGDELFTGDAVRRVQWAGAGTVGTDHDGGLWVDERIPEFSGDADAVAWAASAPRAMQDDIVGDSDVGTSTGGGFFTGFSGGGGWGGS